MDLSRLQVSGKSAWLGHAPFTYWLVGQIRPKKIVELGTHYGDSYFTFCSAITEFGLDTKAFAIDGWLGDGHVGEYGNEVFDYVANHNDLHYKEFSSLIRSRFSDAIQNFEKESIDILHIDGFHTYEAVSEDLRSWLPKVSRNGIVLLHDTHERKLDFGVHMLWDEIKLEYPNHVEFSHSHGLGVFCKSDDPNLTQLIEGFWGSNWRVIIPSYGSALERLSASTGEFMNAIEKTSSLLQERSERIGLLGLELQKIHLSRSWQITAPLRALSSQLMRISNRQG
jgi:hypothetical protein